MEDCLKGCHFVYRLKVSVTSKTVSKEVPYGDFRKVASTCTNSGIIPQLMATVSKVFLVLAHLSYVSVLRNFLSYHL
jgi:hypothetical protein